MKQPSLERRQLMQMLLTTIGASAVIAPSTWASARAGGQSGESSAVFIPPGSGRQGTFGGTAADITFKLDKSQTSGHLGCAEVTLRAGRMGAVPHFHHSFDEICRVLEGTVTVLVGEDVTDVPAGGWHLRPKGMVHAYWNAGTVTSRAIEMYVPGGHEAYMKALVELFAKSATPERADVDSPGKRFDTTFVWDRLPPILEKYGVTL